MSKGELARARKAAKRAKQKSSKQDTRVTESDQTADDKKGSASLETSTELAEVPRIPSPYS